MMAHPLNLDIVDQQFASLNIDIDFADAPYAPL